MISLKQFLRLLQINHILAKHGLDTVIVSLRLFTPFRFIIYFNPWNWFRKEPLPRAVALRQTVEALGPIFIKFGQALSTRPDLLPNDIAKELCKLQDSVPAFPSEQALRLVEAAFGRPASEVFAQFESEPLASASIAQVHAATLLTGEEVVVKILRPNIKQIIVQDVAILKTIASLADRYWPEGKRFKPKEIVLEFEQTLLDELDLQREAANASQLRRNFQHSPLLYVPEIHWPYLRDNLLVMERIYGIPISDLPQLQAAGIHIKRLAERGLEIFFTQVFRDCFFHADMHPGNIFVSTKQLAYPQYICVDFGIMGTLNDQDKRYLAENLLAFFNRDYKRVAELHIESGWLARGTRVEAFESAIRTVCEPIFEKPLKDISFALVVLQLFQVARRFHMEVQPQLVLLQKTLFAVEGLGRQLYPELDLWATAKPFLETWVKEQVSPTLFLKHLRDNVPFMVEQLPHMPRLLYEVLLLTKEQRQAESHLSPLSSASSQERQVWYKGIGVALFWIMLGVASISTLLPPDTVATIALSTAALGGIVALMNWTNRS